MKKKQIITLAFSMFVAAQIFSQSITEADTVCAGSNECYKIQSPIVDSFYKWGIFKGEGKIVFGSGTDSVRIEWDNTTGIDSLWVFETNAGSCSGDTAVLKVVRVAPPTATFKNAKVCHGDDLEVTLSGNAPWGVEYTLNGTLFSESNIIETPYPLSGESGDYTISKVLDKFCSNSASEGIINASIAEPLMPLNIIRK